MLKYGYFISFIRTYGNVAYLGDDEKLDNEIDWFLANKRLFIVKREGRLLSLCVFMILSSPIELVTKKWPDDDPDGKYLWIPYIVIHPAIRNKKLNKQGVIQEMLKAGLEWFPNLEYIVHFRYKREGKIIIIPIEKFFKKEDSYV